MLKLTYVALPRNIRFTVDDPKKERVTTEQRGFLKLARQGSSKNPYEQPVQERCRNRFEPNYPFRFTIGGHQSRR